MIRRLSCASCLALALSLAACGEEKQQASAPPPPPSVTVVRVAAQDVRPSLTFNGRIEAMDKVDLRARVDGFLEKRLFDEGADVKEGDLLYIIEQAPYRASLDEAQANVQKAQAALDLLDIEVRRQSELVKRDAGTQARLDQALGQQGEARGMLNAAKAAVERAQLNLDYTQIHAPISGRIGRSAYSVGNFVSQSSGVLATIVRQDPIFAMFSISQREILAVRSRLGENAAQEADVYLRLADATRYAQAGKIDFIDVTVNRSTDTVPIRATFPNPERTLVDGQLVTVIVEGGQGDAALVIPQVALQADQAGPFVLVVDKDDKIEVRRIDPGPAVGINASVRKGLSLGELVVTEGVQRVRPGQVVTAVEAKAEI